MTPPHAKRGRMAIVGAGESALGQVAAGMTPFDLMAQATSRALDDSGLSLLEIDGVFSAMSQSRMPTIAFCEYLGITPRYQDSTNLGGASFMSLIAHAGAAIESGLCEVALIVYGSTQRSTGRQLIATPDFNPYETPYRPLLPASAYALAASRHMHEYGTTRHDLAEIAVAARHWAQLNPNAFDRAPLTVDEVVNARMVSEPLGIRDCCLVTDGAGAVLVTSARRANGMRSKPVYVLGTGEWSQHASISSMPDLTRTAAVESGRQAYAMAGLGPNDIDVFEVYDAFTITTLLFLEDLGLCPKGEGGRFVQGGALAPGGRIPVNTNGGGLSYCHPGMYGIFVLIEAVRQLRGECGARQVPGCETAIAHGNGGTLSSQSTVILGSAATVE